MEKEIYYHCPEHGQYEKNEGMYCTKCGKKLILAPNCNICGCSFWIHDKFCKKCGTSRDEATKPLTMPEEEEGKEG